jgi:D-aminopeptidase
MITGHLHYQQWYRRLRSVTGAILSYRSLRLRFETLRLKPFIPTFPTNQGTLSDNMAETPSKESLMVDIRSAVDQTVEATAKIMLLNLRQFIPVEQHATAEELTAETIAVIKKNIKVK